MANEREARTVIQQLYNSLHSEDMSSYVSWNNDSSHHFTFHTTAVDFNVAIPKFFSAVRDFEALTKRLRAFGFENKGECEFWHPDGLFCKEKPELLGQIKEKKKTVQPPRPRPFSQGEKSDAISLSKKEADYVDPLGLWTADALTHPSPKRTLPVSTPYWCRPPCNRYKLLVLEKEEMVQTIDVSKNGNYLVGTSPECDLQLEYRFISRYHALLLFKSTGEAYIHDISTNGTFINKKEVPKNVYKDLQIGDWISFGEPTRSYLFQVLSGEGPSKPGGEAAFADIHVSTHPSLNIPTPLQIPDWCRAPPVKYQLQILQNESFTAELNVYGKGRYLFGKLPECDFQLQHKFNSRNHAWLLFKPTGEAYIYDISFYGTYINKEKVLKNDYTQLRIGNWISFGDPTCSYLFKVSGDEVPGNLSAEDVHVSTHPSAVLPLAVEIPDGCGSPPHGYKLQVYENEGMIVEHNLHQKGSYLFGKSQACDFLLKHDLISRTHAWLFLTPNGEACIYDISTGGTYINGKKVQKESYTDLRVGDRISFVGVTRTYLFCKQGD